MNFKELRNQALKEYYPALVLERLWPRGWGRRTLQFLRLSWGLLLLAGALLYGFSQGGNINESIDAVAYVSKVFGAFFLVFGFWMSAYAVRMFYASYYFKSFSREVSMSFELARILYQSSTSDILQGFLESDEGWAAMSRSDISPDDVSNFMSKRAVPLQDCSLVAPRDRPVSLSDYSAAIFEADEEFKKFLFSHGVQKKDFLAVVDWTAERETSAQLKKRWWSRESLGRIPGIGKNWSYGKIYNLEKYARAIPAVEGGEYAVHDVYGSKELKQLESILTRDKSSDALIVGNDNAGSMEIISRLNKMIDDGTAMPQLEHKRLVMLDADMVIASTKDKSGFEALLVGILREAHNSGNIILVLPDFPAFLQTAQSLGADLASILDQYLSSPELQVVALADSERFHSLIEHNSMLMERFERIALLSADASNTVRVLENEIIPLEARYGIFFTYPALVALSQSAERYFPDGIMPDKAIDLLFEIAPKIKSSGTKIVKKEDVLALVRAKTGIPVGGVTVEEREKLLGLENILHHRIIGQDEAVNAIANAVRRARSGINNPDRPLASFLFLGPTGVGKTETTKALGEVFFGQDAQILRLDMSEYSSSEALSKLIGSFEGGKVGVLSALLRDHPYGVLLLDEFEKTTPEVMNLFLQILDEGFFSDMSGKKVNARNLLIIATSNAGSDLIWEAVKKGDNLLHSKDLIIDSIIQSHIFKPELLNRFDGTIIFHPLTNNDLEKIARIQLNNFAKRLAERGLNFIVNDDVVNYVLKFGTDPKFGARPMNRAIQDKIEQVVANKMISGDIRSGESIKLTEKDFGGTI